MADCAYISRKAMGKSLRMAHPKPLASSKPQSRHSVFRAR